MLNCHEATLLASVRLDQRLSARERIVLQLHLLMCRYCSRFARQIRRISYLAKHVGAPKQVRMPEAQRRHLREALEARSAHRPRGA